jgi:hypothetical protein
MSDANGRENKILNKKTYSTFLMAATFVLGQGGQEK